MSGGAERPAPRVAILADDLIWSTRLADGVRRAGAEPVAVRGVPALESLLPSVDGCVVDLTARAYDGIEAIATATRSDTPAIAVAQHDDSALRRAARRAGASRVHAYRGLFEHGDRELGAWVRSLSHAIGEPG